MDYVEAAVPAPPAPPAPPVPPASQSSSHSEVRSAGQETTGNFSWSNGSERVSVNYRGTFGLNDTDTDIVSLSPGGYLKISDGGWLRGRSAEFTADASGAISRRYWVGSSERPFDPEGREWVAKVLLRIVRQSGFAAKERVARFLSKGGPAAVLAEISMIQGSYGKKVYFTQLMKQARLDPSASVRLLEQAGREIDSDYELATTLIEAADKLLVDDATRKAYFDATRGIESDYEMRRVYGSALKRGAISPALVAGILDGATALDSDYEAASLLLDVVKEYSIEGALRAPFFKAVGSIESSYEKGRVLQLLLRRDDLSDETLQAVIRETASIDSDYETAQVLLAGVRTRTLSAAAREACIKAADRLGDYERNRVLAALARR